MKTIKELEEERDKLLEEEYKRFEEMEKKDLIEEIYRLRFVVMERNIQILKFKEGKGK